jgi:type IV pilus assembly protein PilB
MAAAVKSLNLKPGGRVGGVELEASGGEGAEDAPVIRIVADTLREAVQIGASDVHIEPQQNYLRVRFRIGGDLEEAASLPAELSQPVISRVKVMSNLRIDETRIPQDGRFHAKILDRDIDFRVSTFPTPLGEKMAIRVLDPKTGLKTLDELGLSGTNLEAVNEGIAKPFGMVLISGPTGSGKTTTLYAILQLLNNEKVNIVSLEDPVEYFVSGVNQSQVRPEIKYDFASGLREILRQDPDVIMVGEIRDNETAGLAIHAALTGHIVLSTIHTNNAVGVLPRLIDMEVEPFILPEAVNMMISQRLVSKLCDSCKKAEPAPEAIKNEIENALQGLPENTRAKYKAPYQIYHAQGCSKCKGKGTIGRVAVFEVFNMTRELGDIVSSGPTVSKIMAEAKRQGMITMREDGVVKALEGLVPLEEVLRETAE